MQVDRRERVGSADVESREGGAAGGGARHVPNAAVLELLVIHRLDARILKGNPRGDIRHVDGVRAGAAGERVLQEGAAGVVELDNSIGHKRARFIAHHATENRSASVPDVSRICSATWGWRIAASAASASTTDGNRYRDGDDKPGNPESNVAFHECLSLKAWGMSSPRE